MHWKNAGHTALLRGALTLGVLGSCFAAQDVNAQANPTNMNVLCVYNPSIGDYQINIYRNPGQNHVHTVSPAPTGVCTANGGDLMNWIQQDLQANGTWNVVQLPSGGFGLGGDQIDTALDVFCPGPDNPSSVGGMQAHVYPPTAHNPHPQAGVVLNFTCPSVPTGGGGTVPQPSATYPVDACVDGVHEVSTTVIDDAAASMTITGPVLIGSGQNNWQISTSGGFTPVQNTALPVSVNQCDADAAAAAEAYLQGQIGTMNPVDLGVDAFSCPSDELQVYVNSCEDHGTHGTYGFEIHCCPPPDPDPVGTTGKNCHSVCMGPPGAGHALGVHSVTHGYGPNNPTFHNVPTVCQDLENATRTWMDTTVPGGPTQPWMCGPNWAPNQGGFYVPGTLNMTCGVQSTSDPQCGGSPRVRVCLEYNCDMERHPPRRRTAQRARDLAFERVTP